MSKSILLSIHPKWCELIASGKKTVEVRKTAPKLEPPFKVYIYCTKNTKKKALHTYIRSGYGRKEFGIIEHWRSGKEVVDVNAHMPAYRYNAYLAEGKIIGEFMCDRIEEIGFSPEMHGKYVCKDQSFIEQSCIPFDEMFDYLGEEYGYGWHISDLVIYDELKELSEFFYACNKPKGTDCSVCLDHRENRCKAITRPPQSWCYVYNFLNTGVSV